MSDEKTVWGQIADIGYSLTTVYRELIELSNEIEYRNGDKDAGDDLKVLAGYLMDEIQRLYPMDY